MDYSAIFWIGWGLALLVLVPHVWGWWRTVVLFRGIDSTRIRQMLHLCRFTGHLRILVLSLAMLVALFTPILILGAPVPLGVTAVMAAVALVGQLAISLP